MSKENEYILGEVQLDSGKKGIIPLNDVFLTFTFIEETNWETLRKIVNIFYTAYKDHYKDSEIELIKGKISVSTQFPYYRDFDYATPKRQDVRIEGDEMVNYVEFQYNPYPEPSINERSVKYFGFSLTRGKEKRAQNLWLINGGVGDLLNGNTFSNYVLRDELNNLKHPTIANILYVDLKRLAKTDTRAGELAGVLIGTVETPKDPIVDEIFQNLKESFDDFKENMEVRKIMSRTESLLAEGKAEGKAEGRVEGRVEGKAEAEAELLPQINEQAEQITEQAEQITKQKTRIEDLEALVAQFKQQSKLNISF